MPLRQKVVLANYLVPDDQDPELQMTKAYEIFLVNGLRVNYMPETGMTTISVISFDPAICAEVCNQIVVEFEDYTQKILSKNSMNYAQFIEERTKEISTSLERSEKDLNIFLEKNRVTNSSPALKLEHSRLKREVLLHQQLFISLKEQFELANIEAQKNISKISVLDKAVVPVAKFRPRRSLMLAFAILLGCFLALLQSFVRYYFRFVFSKAHR